MDITSRHFGDTLFGDAVIEYTITNNQGASVSILNLGGIIRKINVPDSKGSIQNVVVGFDTLKAYENCPDFIGATIGRSGGRIANARFTIDDVQYLLAKNSGEHNLHGGPHAFDKTIWEVGQLIQTDKASVSLHYLSPDMEEGFPGNLDTIITYTFDNENNLTIKYIATTDKKTFVNLTNHSYFNLSGDFSTKITDHTLWMNCDNLVAIDESTIPIGLLPVDGTAFDFKKEKKIGQDINADEEQIRFGTGYDHAFELVQPSKGPQLIAKDPKSGRTLEVTTDAACVVFYTGNYLKADYISCDKVPLQSRAAFCLETQYYPDAPNSTFVDPHLLDINKVYKTTTTFSFK